MGRQHHIDINEDEDESVSSFIDSALIDNVVRDKADSDELAADIISEGGSLGFP